MERILLGNSGVVDGIINVNADPITIRNLEGTVKNIRRLLMKGYMSGYDCFYAFIPEITVGGNTYTLVQYNADLQELDPRNGTMADAAILSPALKSQNLNEVFRIPFYTREEFASGVYKNNTLPNENTPEFYEGGIDAQILRLLISAVLDAVKYSQTVGFTFSEKDIHEFSKRSIGVYKAILEHLPYYLRKKIGFISRCDSIESLPREVNLCAYSSDVALKKTSVMEVINLDNISRYREKDEYKLLIDYLFDNKAAMDELYENVEKPCEDNNIELSVNSYIRYINIKTSDISKLGTINYAKQFRLWMIKNRKELEVFSYFRDYVVKIIENNKAAVEEYIYNEMNKSSVSSVIKLRKQFDAFFDLIKRYDIINMDKIESNIIDSLLLCCTTLDEVIEINNEADGQLNVNSLKKIILKIFSAMDSTDDIINGFDKLSENNITCMSNADRSILLNRKVAEIRTFDEIDLFIDKVGEKYMPLVDEYILCDKISFIACQVQSLGEIKHVLSIPGIKKYFDSGLLRRVEGYFIKLINRMIEKAQINQLKKLQKEEGDIKKYIEPDKIRDRIRKLIEDSSLTLYNVPLSEVQSVINMYLNEYNGGKSIIDDELLKKIGSAIKECGKYNNIKSKSGDSELDYERKVIEASIHCVNASQWNVHGESNKEFILDDGFMGYLKELRYLSYEDIGVFSRISMLIILLNDMQKECIDTSTKECLIYMLNQCENYIVNTIENSENVLDMYNSIKMLVEEYNGNDSELRYILKAIKHLHKIDVCISKKKNSEITKLIDGYNYRTHDGSVLFSADLDVLCRKWNNVQLNREKKHEKNNQNCDVREFNFSINKASNDKSSSNKNDKKNDKKNENNTDKKNADNKKNHDIKDYFKIRYLAIAGIALGGILLCVLIYVLFFAKSETDTTNYDSIQPQTDSTGTMPAPNYSGENINNKVQIEEPSETADTQDYNQDITNDIIMTAQPQEPENISGFRDSSDNINYNR